VRGEAGGVLVVDDFAHHPTAVRETIRAVCERWPGRRVVAVFEPRSNSSRRKTFEAAYTEAFDDAGLAFFSTPPFRHNDRREDFMDMEVVVRSITERGTAAFSYPGADVLLPPLLDQLQPGDVALIMSNGGFGGIHDKLLTALQDGG
jgi:UDP-N-acetylmuramate: L-alanyl-gamma-D-glutamyl-meso-diaminopimelate ligase